MRCSILRCRERPINIDYTPLTRRIKERKNIIVALLSFVLIGAFALTLVILQLNDNEEITRLNQNVSDFRDQIDLMRQHQFAARRKMIEERERQRTESRYYTETKKLAICFSGFLRNFSLTEQRIRNELFSLFGEENIDIFMYVPQVIKDDQIQPLPNISWSVTELRTYKQQDLREPKSGYLYHYRTNFQGWLQQYYGIAGCYNVIREYQERTRIKYEWV